MSVEDEKKPRKPAAKKKAAVAPSTDAAVSKKVKAAAPKPAAAPKKKVAANSINETPAAGLIVETETSKAPLPTHAQIAERAHYYFIARGRLHGFHVEDWLRAEHELLAGR